MCKSVDSSTQARTLLAAAQAVLLELEEVSAAPGTYRRWSVPAFTSRRVVWRGPYSP